MKLTAGAFALAAIGLAAAPSLAEKKGGLLVAQGEIPEARVVDVAIDLFAPGVSDEPPSRDDVTTSRTWAECTEVKTFTSSGMIAPASVPQVMTTDNFHHSDGSPPRFGIVNFDTMKVSTTDTIDVNQTSCVSGTSKLNFTASA